MADTYEQNLGQKSRLTKSDFIRVVGSDNVSYKQLVSDVNKTTPLNTVSGLTTEALIDQAYITAHTETPDDTPYRRLLSHGMAHSILGGGAYYLEGYRASASYGWQKTTSYGNPTRIFTRSINNGTWTTWAKEPTRAEIDALNSKSVLTLTPNTEVLSSLGMDGMSARRNGNIVYRSGYVQIRADSSVQKDTTLFTIPRGHRPAVTITSMAARVDNNAISPEIAIVNTNGVVALHNGTANPASTYVRFSIMYPVE